MGTQNDPQSQKVIQHKAAMQNGELRRKFGREKSDIPGMEREKSSELFKKLVEDVQDDQTLKTLLVVALSAVKDDDVTCYYVPTATETMSTESSGNGESESDDDTSPQNLVEKVLREKGSLHALPCETLGGALEGVIQEKGQDRNVVQIEYAKWNVVPPGNLNGLDYTSENHDTYITIIRGELIWIFWPRTAENIEVMQQAYQRKADGIPEETKAITDQLKHGVILGQRAGECLRLPPLCIYMCVPTEFTVLSRYQLMSALHFVDSLEVSAEFHRSFLATYGAARAKQLFHGYSKNRRDMICRILRRDFESYEPGAWAQNTNKPGPMRDLIQKWDTVKHNVAKLLSYEDAVIVRQVWIDTLRVLRNGQCAVCGASGDLYDAGQHFDEVHGFDAFSGHEEAGHQQISGMGGYVLGDAYETPDGANGEEAEPATRGYPLGEPFQNGMPYGLFTPEGYDPMSFDE
ncbi:hypothetical protein P171DRAFT_429654 [Karstenula rhodostoma CBS 690.94]|uniref:Uncharacterized protein n=1 Tax=Karstenula rhodostoma CBS 690.94 TaxID=1392251 RepID=A0A9P4PKC6_9PLEO|nr:hypothetical protein P171DRAFT_429654 [Karstenula rhodostoma CBS 690.94]